MFVLARALTFATLFIGFVLVFLPSQVLSASGLSRPSAIGLWQVVGLLGVIAGGALGVWCVLTFAVIGKGTPAPFDPPRRLVIRGPYRFVRNPMYVGAGGALAGAALFYGSIGLFGYAALFLIAMHVFVVTFEEPTLRRTFGQEYDGTRGNVGRWWPHRTATFPSRDSGD